MTDWDDCTKPPAPDWDGCEPKPAADWAPCGSVPLCGITGEWDIGPSYVDYAFPGKIFTQGSWEYTCSNNGLTQSWLILDESTPYMYFSLQEYDVLIPAICIATTQNNTGASVDLPFHYDYTTQLPWITTPAKHYASYTVSDSKGGPGTEVVFATYPNSEGDLLITVPAGYWLQFKLYNQYSESAYQNILQFTCPITASKMLDSSWDNCTAPPVPDWDECLAAPPTEWSHVKEPPGEPVGSVRVTQFVPEEVRTLNQGARVSQYVVEETLRVPETDMRVSQFALFEIRQSDEYAP